MAEEPARNPMETVEVDLRQPGLAAFWAWIWPGAGHLYQRRYAKGVLYMVCVLGTYFFGLAMGDGHVVYASFHEDDFRWQYICQLGVGLPALPAIVQNQRVANDREPLGDIMAPPQDLRPSQRDELAQWHEDLHIFFELGTLYTMIAGLLNLLAIYDAYAGPSVASPDESRERSPPERSKKPADRQPS